jgi:uncharacterized protein YndB with AHSA1/START domain
MNAAPDLTVSRHVAAPPDVVWRAVADPARVTGWSPESAGITREDGGDGPMVVGTRFSGTNRNGLFRWSTKCRVVESAAPSAFAFDVTYVGLAVARWRYLIEPADGGSLVREEWYDHRGALMKLLGTVGTGVADRETHNRGTMEATLDALARELGRTEA